MTHYVIIIFLDSHGGREAHKQFKTFMPSLIYYYLHRREREREGERERERETDRQTDRQTETDRQREREANQNTYNITQTSAIYLETLTIPSLYTYIREKQ